MIRSIIRLTAMMIIFAPMAQAEDVYNFYFQKNKPKEEAVVEAPKPEEKVEEEYIEVPQDVLLVPDNWRPAHQNTKKYYYKEQKNEENTLKTEAEEGPEGRSRRGWSMAIGVGSVKIDHIYGGWGNTALVQDVYVLGARYHMSKYFDVNAEVLAPDGDMEYGSYGTFGTALDPQVNIGLGVTPIHLNVFGGELFEIGADGGVSIGNKTFLMDSNSVYLGPRVSLNIGDHFSLSYTGKFDMNSDIEYAINTFTVGYKW